MAWIESHTVLIRHRKLRELALSLRLCPVYAMGHLHALWHAALEQQEDGDLSRWSDEFIAESSGFNGDAPQYVRLLHTHGWLDGKLIHDWLTYAGRYLESKYRTSQPERLISIWAKHGQVWQQTDKRRTTDSPPKGLGQVGSVEVPLDLKGNEKEILDWLAYKRERGESYKPRGLAGLWVRIREIAPEMRSAAIQHSIANNWAGLFEKKGGSRNGTAGYAEPRAGKYPD